jgi:hypothetical protein
MTKGVGNQDTRSKVGLKESLLRLRREVLESRQEQARSLLAEEVRAEPNHVTSI